MKTANLITPTNRLAGRNNGGSPATSISTAVVLPEFKPLKCSLHVVGTSPLIVHNWSHKAIIGMLGKQTGEAVKPKEKKDPFEDFRSSLYPINNGKEFGFPAPAFKACAVTASNDLDMKMTEMRRAFHVCHYTVPVKGPAITQPQNEWDDKYKARLKPYWKQGISMRMDMVRLATGVADIRFRAWYPEWECNLEVEYNESVISLPQLVALFRAGGYGVGIGEWRPSSPQCKSGEFGRFEIQ